MVERSQHSKMVLGFKKDKQEAAKSTSATSQRTNENIIYLAKFISQSRKWQRV